MNTHLNYLIANERVAELGRIAEQARLAEKHRAIEQASSRAGWTAGALARLRLWLAGGRTRAAVES